jgi:4'-phosphopantetheinyl transferase
MTGFRPVVLARAVVVAMPVIRVTTAWSLESDRAGTGVRSPTEARAHLAARGCLRHLLAHVLERTTAERAVVYDALGAPALDGRPDIGISVSHSGDWVAAAVAPHAPVGVDVQEPRPVSDRLVARCCADHAHLFRSLPPARRYDEVAWVWSVQEACAKATGTGLAARPWRIPVAPGQVFGRWSGYAWVALRREYPLPVSCAWADAPPMTPHPLHGTGTHPSSHGDPS